MSDYKVRVSLRLFTAFDPRPAVRRLGCPRQVPLHRFRLNLSALISYIGAQSRASSNGKSTTLRNGTKRTSISKFCTVVSVLVIWSVPSLPVTILWELSLLAAYDALRLGRSQLSSGGWS
jgi:hypothetical protein